MFVIVHVISKCPVSTKSFMNEMYNFISCFSSSLHYGYSSMVVGFPTTYAISAYHYLSCEFDYEVYFRNASYSLMYISKSFSPQIKIYDALELI